MRLIRPCAGALLITASSAVSAADWYFSGTFEQEAAFKQDNQAINKQESQILPELTLSFDSGLEITNIWRLRYDALDKLVGGESSDASFSDLSKPLTKDAHAELELRELYLDYRWERIYLRLGKQQIVWGQADGLKVLDVVNPQSFREFILDEFDDSRIPLWTLNIEYDLTDDLQLQWLWIPDTTYNERPSGDALFSFTSPLFIPQFTPANLSQTPSVQLLEGNKPKTSIANADTGLRLSGFFAGWDLTLNYLYHYLDNPVISQRLDEQGLSLEPLYKRSHLYGFTASNAFGDFTFRGEWAYLNKTWHLSQNLSQQGLFASGEFNYVIGLDWQGLSDTIITAQFFQSILESHNPQVYRDKIQTNYTFLIERTFLNESWTARAQWLYNQNLHDGLLRTKITHNLLSNLDLWLGADWFYGNAEGFFGQFRQQDRWVLGLELGF